MSGYSKGLMSSEFLQCLIYTSQNVNVNIAGISSGPQPKDTVTVQIDTIAIILHLNYPNSFFYH